jgi:hypothetical protein
VLVVSSLLRAFAMSVPNISPKALKANRELHRYYESTCSTYPELYPFRSGCSWVQGRFNQNVFLMGCLVCEKAGAQTPFGHFAICTRSEISTSVLKKHQRSKAHTEALLCNGASVLGAPSAECFRKVLETPCTADPHMSPKKLVADLGKLVSVLAPSRLRV